VIDKDYVVEMSRYNAWQNNQIRQAVKAMSDEALQQDRGAFFGSLFSTLNHLLWGDTIWMSRWCSDVQTPRPADGDAHLQFTATASIWDAERFRMDGRIRIWAQTLSNMDLHGELSWYSGATDQHITKPVALCIAHMFNHQTHHRGQISQMLSEMGVKPPVSDIVFMPEDA